MTKPNANEGRRVPGETGVWVFIIGDITVFAIFFLIYAKYYREAPTLFLNSQEQLDKTLGALNTLILLTSSLFVALGLRALRDGVPRLSQRFLGLAFLCAVGFSIVKYVEYSDKVAHGHTLIENFFFTFYFMLTGIHMVHVVIGSVVLLLMMKMLGKGRSDRLVISRYETGAAYWHMVDLLWIVLFPLLYLVR